MRIEAYFEQVRQTIEGCPVVQTSSVAYDKRSTHEGFISGELYLVDGSILYIREFVDVETRVDRLTYVYQYVAPTLVFRYDNTGHHRRRGLPSYPHHKHEGSEKNVVAASEPDLAGVLREIEALVRLP